MNPNLAQKLKDVLAKSIECSVFVPQKVSVYHDGFCRAGALSPEDVIQYAQKMYDKYPQFSEQLDSVVELFLHKLQTLIQKKESYDVGKIDESLWNIYKKGFPSDAFRKFFIEGSETLSKLLFNGNLLGQVNEQDNVHPELLLAGFYHSNEMDVQKLSLLSDWFVNAQNIINTISSPEHQNNCAKSFSTLLNEWFDQNITLKTLESVTDKRFLPQDNQSRPFVFLDNADEEFLQMVIKWVDEGGVVDPVNYIGHSHYNASCILNKIHGSRFTDSDYFAFMQSMWETYGDEHDVQNAIFELSQMCHSSINPKLFQEMCFQGYDAKSLTLINKKLENLPQNPYFAMFQIMCNLPTVFAMAKMLEIPEAIQISQFHQQAEKEFERLQKLDNTHSNSLNNSKMKP